MLDLPELSVDLPSIDHVGLVVEDIEDGMKRYSQLLGLGPWNVYNYEPPALTDGTYHGEPAEYGMRLCLAQAGDIYVELIEPTISPNVYEDHLAEHGEGLHHVACLSFEDPHAVLEAFEEAGIDVIQSGFVHGANFWYLDTASELNGVILETGDRGVRDSPLPEPDAVYPPESEVASIF